MLDDAALIELIEVPNYGRQTGGKIAGDWMDCLIAGTRRSLHGFLHSHILEGEFISKINAFDSNASDSKGDEFQKTH